MKRHASSKGCIHVIPVARDRNDREMYDDDALQLFRNHGRGKKDRC